MSKIAITKNLTSSPLPAALAYFLIMSIGGCFAREKYLEAANTPGVTGKRAVQAYSGNINQTTVKNKTRAAYYPASKSNRQ